MFWSRYADSAAKAQREVRQEDIAAWGGFLLLTPDKHKAQELLAEHTWFWDKWFIPFGQKMPNVLIGSADEIADRIGRAHDRLKFNELFLMFGQGHVDPEENNEQLEQFATKVAPRFASKNEAGILV
jgi:alkanesulfonate monooxygenase SsuD/methylene tetrahydromethanopterin reductase-like flavin-dependent oxidoreductase (luciferase family)